MMNTATPKYTDYDALLGAALANAIAEGDYVNFRLIFAPASPFRLDSPEDATTPKYQYLFPENENSPRYQAAVRLVQSPPIKRYVKEQLQRSGPPRLPWQLLLALADNALCLGKFTLASQAYELLRIRRRMQDLFLEEADERLRADNLSGAVKGYLIGLGLQFDYGAFPEPLPAVPDYQERAPGLHTVYTGVTEDALGMQEDVSLCKSILGYLMPFPEFKERVQKFLPDQLIPFTAALIRGMDPNWDTFATDFRKTMHVASRYTPLFTQINSYSLEALEVLAEELVQDKELEELRHLSETLTGLSGGLYEWWRYISALAYAHPAAPFFVVRQRISAHKEIIVPCCRQDSTLSHLLGLR